MILPSGWICTVWQLDNEFGLVSLPNWLVIEINRSKTGGFRAYRWARPLFFGLILGEFAVGTVWTIIGVILNQPSYAFWY